MGSLQVQQDLRDSGHMCECVVGTERGLGFGVAWSCSGIVVHSTVIVGLPLSVTGVDHTSCDRKEIPVSSTVLVSRPKPQIAPLESRSTIPDAATPQPYHVSGTVAQVKVELLHAYGHDYLCRQKDPDSRGLRAVMDVNSLRYVR